MRRILTTAAIALLMTTAAHADNVTQLYSSGDWSAFRAARSSEGKPMCGAKVSLTFAGDDKGSMTIKYSNESGLFLHLRKDSWSFAPGLDVPLDISIGNFGYIRSGVSEVSPTGKSMVEMDFSRSFLDDFVSDNANTKTMTVTFKESDEQPWVVSMNGARDTVKAFVLCMNEVATIDTSPVVPRLHR